MIGLPQKTALIIAVAGAVVSAVLLSPQVCLAFGERGHAGVFQGALRLLRATESCATPWTDYSDPSRAPTIWPDAAVKYNLEQIPSKITTLFELLGSLNSGDHYFDPRSSQRGRVAGPWVFDDDDDPETPQTQRSPPLDVFVGREVLKKVIQGAHGTAPAEQFTALAAAAGSSPVGDWDQGADGIGYNAVTSTLFLLNGRAEGDTTNPTLLSPTRGFADLAKSGQWKPAELALGCAMHYVGDLASPGHTHWKSPWQLESKNPPVVDQRFYHPDHEDFDHLGDTFWTDARRRDKLSRLLDGTRPTLIRRFDSSGKVCTGKGRKGMGAPGEFAWDEDLPRALLELAQPSRSLWDDHWKFHGTSNDFWAEGDFSGPCVDRFAAHLAGAAATAAGVIDWAFSRGTAEGKDKDGPYSRDATNFLGMAAALAAAQDAGGALLTPESLQGKDCYLGGIDRDDYFPISGPQVSRVSVAVKEGPKEAVKVEVFDPAGTPLPVHVKPGTDAIDLYLGKAVDKFLLRVYSPDGKAVTYTISFPPPDVQMIVDAEAAVVKRGKPIKFTGKVVDKAGRPVAGVTVGVEDPVTQQTAVLPVDPQGAFSYTCQTPLTKPGVYTFVFLCTRAPEQVYAVGVIDDGYPKVSLSRVQVPLGNWGTIGESFGQRPEVFTTVTRTTTSQGGPPPVLPQPYAPPSDKTQMLATARAWADDVVAGSVEEFMSSPVNVGAVYVAAATCPFPDVTVTKATCAGSVAYIEAAALEAVTKTVFKKAIDSSDLSPQDKEAWKLGVDQAFFVFDVLQLDPKAGPKSAKGVEQTLNMLAVQWDAPQVIFQSVQAPSPGTDAAPRGYVAMPLKSGEVLSIVARGTPPPQDKGMLDLVLCIEKSGSMADDIKAVQDECDATLEALDQFAKANKIDLRVGLVTYTRHDEPNWIQGNPLTADVATIRRYIQAISITNLALGKGGNEDMYGALMYAMNEPVGGQKMAMGWRPGAAKIVFPIGDEPPDDPDWEERTLDDVARVAKNLDPVHMYPLLTPKQGSTFLDPAARAMERIAKATGGQVFRVASAGELPETLVAAVKLAVRQHRNEVWRKHNQPYVLYGAIGALLGLMVLTTVGLILRAALSSPKRPTPLTPTPQG